MTDSVACLPKSPSATNVLALRRTHTMREGKKQPGTLQSNPLPFPLDSKS